MSHSETAEELFRNNCNCSQALLGAFADIIKLPIDMALKLSSAFGGGFARKRETCGVLVSALMIIGYTENQTAFQNDDEKGRYYSKIQDFCKQFSETFGSSKCRELLGGADDSPIPTPRTESFYTDRPCLKIVTETAKLLDRYLLIGIK